jgi:hypothetical protein
MAQDSAAAKDINASRSSLNGYDPRIRSVISSTTE